MRKVRKVAKAQAAAHALISLAAIAAVVPTLLLPAEAFGGTHRLGPGRSGGPLAPPSDASPAPPGSLRLALRASSGSSAIDALGVSDDLPRQGDAPLSTSSLSSDADDDSEDVEPFIRSLNRLSSEFTEIIESLHILLRYTLLIPDDDVTAEAIVRICDYLDEANSVKTPEAALRALVDEDNPRLFTEEVLDLRVRALRAGRYGLLMKMMRNDYDDYVAVASFLSPGQIVSLQNSRK